MTYDGRNYLADAGGIFVILFIVCAVLFYLHNRLGIIFVVGLLFYFMFFMSKDKKMKKEDLDDILSPLKSSKVYKQILPSEIP